MRRLRVGIAIAILLLGIAAFFVFRRSAWILPAHPEFESRWKVPSGPLKVMTYNIEFGNRLEEALGVIVAERADVVLLQEIRPAQMAEIEKALKMEGTWFPSSNLIGDAAWGNAVFSRGRVRQGQSIPNGSGGSFGVWAAVEIDDARFIAASVHLMHAKTYLGGFPTREKEIRNLLNALVETKAPAIIAGDFNNPPTGGNYSLLLGNLTDAGKDAGPTLPATLAVLRVDYVFTTGEWKTESAKTIATRISDHLPVVVTLQKK